MLSTAGLEVWRCTKCRRILAEMSLQPGSAVRVKCSCNTFNMVEYGIAQFVNVYACSTSSLMLLQQVG